MMYIIAMKDKSHAMSNYLCVEFEYEIFIQVSFSSGFQFPIFPTRNISKR